MVDYTDIVQTAWKHYDAVLEAKIQHIHELTGVEKERLIKINPLEFIESMPDMFIRDYQYQDLGEWVAKMKTPETFLISPIDEDVETANQICYKTGQTTRKLRAHKCEVQPITKLAAKRFFVKNHRQSLPTLSDNSVSYALVFGGEVVAVMTYDYTQSAVRGLAKADKFELLRLSIKHGTQINGGASKLEKACEEAIRHWGCNEIFSYSNATINEGNVYRQLGFTQSAIETGQAWVVERDFSLVRLVNCCEVRGLAGAKNSDLLKRRAVKVHVTANRTWVKDISIKEDANV
jgi:hypothetical protein